MRNVLAPVLLEPVQVPLNGKSLFLLLRLVIVRYVPDRSGKGAGIGSKVLLQLSDFVVCHAIDLFVNFLANISHLLTSSDSFLRVDGWSHGRDPPSLALISPVQRDFMSHDTRTHCPSTAESRMIAATTRTFNRDAQIGALGPFIREHTKGGTYCDSVGGAAKPSSFSAVSPASGSPTP